MPTPLSDRAVRALFAGTNVGHLATVQPDGSPHSAPLWVDADGDRILFLTGPDTRKARNIDRDPRVAISVTDAQNPNVMGTVRGRAEKVDGEAGWELVDRLARKYTGGPYPRGEERVGYVLVPDQVWGMSFA